MAKNKTLPLVLIVLGTLGLVISGFALVQGTILFDDFVSEIDFTVNPDAMFCIDQETCTDEQFKVTGSGMTLNSNLNGLAILKNLGIIGNAGASDNVLTHRTDLRGRDIKIFSEVVFFITKKYRGGDIRYYLGGKQIHTEGNYCSEGATGDACRQGITRPVFIEIFSSRLDTNQVEVRVNNGATQQLTFQPDDVIDVRIDLKGSGGGRVYSYVMQLTDIKTKRPFSCNLENNELLAYEPFAGGREISDKSMRYTVRKYCLDHPAVIFKGDQGTDTTAEIYDRLNKGETLPIPDDEVWGIFYVFKNDGTIPAVCNPDEAFNTETGKCTDVGGLVTFCSEGSFDPAIGACVVQPEIRNVCEEGRFDVTQGKCIYNPPIQAVCENPDAVFNPGSGKCEYVPDEDVICPRGGFNGDTGKCEYRPETEAVCDFDFTYNVIKDRCEFTPDHAIVCPDGSTFNPINSVCEKFPLQTIICDPLFAYNSITDKCERTVDTVSKCDDLEGVYIPQTGKCEKVVESEPTCDKGTLTQKDDGVYSCIFEPELEIKCPTGTNYRPDIDKCVYIPDEEAICNIGVYEEVTNTCQFTPPSQAVCPQGTSYDLDEQKCIYVPPSEAECEVGTYDNVLERCVFTPDELVVCAQGDYEVDRNACVIEPDLTYLCLQGELNEDQSSCTITPEETVFCRAGFDFNETSGFCEGFPDEIQQSATTVIKEAVKENKTTLSIVGSILSLLSMGIGIGLRGGF